MATGMRIPHVFSRRFLWAGYLIGLALGGFFDGIVLHQLLQWHHLLSGLETEAARDLRFQIVADGVFHAAMYAVAAVGLWMLYRSRKEFTDGRADRNLLADVLIGFGAWHVIDAVLDHWVLGIHRIRMDVANPLVWDIGWLVLFGLPPLIAGLLMKRRYPRATQLRERRTAGSGLALSLAALVLAAGWAGSQPPRGGGEETVTVVLRPDVRPGEFLAALAGDDARVLWSDRRGGVWVLAPGEDGSRLRFYRHGALFVSGAVLPAGCSAWLET